MAGPLDFTLAAFHADDPARMTAARHIRQTVFCDEQGVPPDLEWDGKDTVCEHFLLLADDAPIACARLRPYGPGIFKVERVAVLKEFRGKGAGVAIMRHLLDRLADTSVVLNAQLAVEAFYQKLDFVSEGPVFEEAGIPHVHMVWRP